MVFPKKWDSKPKVLAFPSRIDNYFVCHNCCKYGPSDGINPCTGLCETCQEMNPTLPTAERTSSDGCGAFNCTKCGRQLQKNNFGINRNVCNDCEAEPALIQRCVHCDTWTMDCWHHTCHRCRLNKGLCEKTGYLYRNGIHHKLKCWCVPHEYAVYREKKYARFSSSI